MMKLDPDRIVRAVAIIGASVCLKGRDNVDLEMMLGIADELTQYITGDDGAKIPRPDKATGNGGIPRI